MRTSIALFFIGLIAMTMAYNNDVKFLKSLKRKDYGRTLLDTIQIQMMSAVKGNGIDEVVAVLKQLKESQAEEQKEDDDENSKFQSETANNVAHLTDEINKLEQEIKDDTALIASNEGQITTLQVFVQETEEDLASQEASLEENQGQQNKTTADFNRDFAALSAQVTGLAAAKEVLVTLESEPETQAQQFLQIKSSIKSIKFVHKKYQGMINVLSQLMTNQVVADPQLVANIIEIIDKLSLQLQAEVKQLQSDYELKIDYLHQIQQQLENQIAQDHTNIDSSNQRIAQLQQENSDAAQRNLQNGQERDSDVQQRTDAVQAGVDRQNSHDQQTARRNDENSVIDQVVSIFQTRFSDDVRAVVRTL